MYAENPTSMLCHILSFQLLSKFSWIIHQVFIFEYVNESSRTGRYWFLTVVLFFFPSQNSFVEWSKSVDGRIKVWQTSVGIWLWGFVGNMALGNEPLLCPPLTFCLSCFTSLHEDEACWDCFFSFSFLFHWLLYWLWGLNYWLVFQNSVKEKG